MIGRRFRVAEESCEEWVKEQVAKETLKVEVADGFVKMAKPSSSVYVVIAFVNCRYEQVMERTQDLKRAVEGMKRSSQ